jgi:hypothetical protein
MTHVKSLGNSLKGKDRLTWRKIAEDAFEGDDNYIQISPGMRKGEEREFFILLDGEEKIGRACATVDKEWIEKKGEKIGFIDDFTILPDHKKDGSILIKHCLSVLKDEGLDGVFVRNNGFPALQVEGFEHPPPAYLPYNPSFYVDLFLDSGFQREKEWHNIRLKLSSIKKEDILVGEKRLKDSKMEFIKLNLRDKRAVKEYSDLVHRTFIGHFGFNPREFIAGYDTFFKRIFTRITTRIMRFQIYVGKYKGKDGKMVLYFSFFPDINVFFKSLREKGKNPFGLIAMLKLMLGGAKKIKRAKVGSLGLDESIRNIGIVSDMLGYGLNLVVKEGYDEIDTGVMLAENLPVLRIVEKIAERWGIEEVILMKYYTFSYKFSP